MSVILHLSDIHLDSAHGVNSPIWPLYQLRAWLSSVRSGLEEALNSSAAIDLVAITGDFVHRGQQADWPNVAIFIDELKTTFEVNDEQIICCPGNHDLLPTTTDDDHLARLKPYYDVCGRFGPSFELSPTGLHRFYSGGVCPTFSLDSTSGGPPHRPGDITDNDKRWILETIDRLPVSLPLLILSHFPAVSFDIATASEESNWADSHVWLKATPLYNIIKFNRMRRGAVIWLTGDVHKQMFSIDEPVFRAGVGRFGTAYASTSRAVEESIVREMQIVNIKSPEDISFASLQNRVESWSAAPSFKWQLVHRPLRRAIVPVAPKEALTPAASIPISAATEVAAASNARPKPVASDDDITPAIAEMSAPEEHSSMSVDCMDRSLDRMITEAVSDVGVYTLGRFRHTPKEDVLGRIRLGPLLNSEGLLDVFSASAATWIRKNGDINHTTLIGIDCWGAIMAGLVSVRLAAPVVLMSALDANRLASAEQQLQTLEKTVRPVVFTDVIVSGKSINRALINIERHCPSLANCDVIAFICDAVNITKLSKKSFAVRVVSACTSLRIPVLPLESLPPESIAPYSSWI